jgi:hypothetical protein
VLLWWRGVDKARSDGCITGMCSVRRREKSVLVSSRALRSEPIDCADDTCTRDELTLSLATPSRTFCVTASAGASAS